MMNDGYHPSNEASEAALASLERGLDLGTYLAVALELAHRYRNQRVAREIASHVADEPRQVFVRVRQMIYTMLAEPDLLLTPSARRTYVDRLTDAARDLVIPKTLDRSAELGIITAIYSDVSDDVYEEFLDLGGERL